MSPSRRRRTRANRENARKSTGPRTPEGKARSRTNALRHGLLAASVVVPECDELESHEQFDQLLSDMARELQPVGIIEEILVEQIAVSYWRLRRALRLEAGNIAGRVQDHHRWYPKAPLESSSMPTLESAHLIIRYESTIERRLNRALATLERLQTRRKEKPGQAGNHPCDPANSTVVTENKKLPNEPNSPQPTIQQPDTAKNSPAGSRYLQPDTCLSLVGHDTRDPPPD